MMTDASAGKKVFLGRVGENEARVVRFSVGKMLAAFPGATFTVLNRRPCDAAAYPVNDQYVSLDGDTVLWTIQSGDVTVAGTGECEIRAEKDGKILKSQIYMTATGTALDGSGTPPQPWESWVQQVEDAAEDAEAAAQLLENVTAAAETLEAGEQATASYADGVFTFGIPRGADGQGGGISDVKVNNSSVVTDGVANVPIASTSALGVVLIGSNKGVYADPDGTLKVDKASDAQVKDGNAAYRPIVPIIQHQSVFYGLAKAAGDTSQASSSNAVGNYTADAIVKIQKMLGLYKSPWEVIRSDTITNATEGNITITVDDNGNAFELTDIAVAFVLSAQENDTASYGESGRVRYYYGSNYDDTMSSSISISDTGTKKGFYTFVEQDGNMLRKSAISNVSTGNRGNMAMYVSEMRSTALYAIDILTEPRVYDKIEFRAVKGVADFVIYGRRKP